MKSRTPRFVLGSSLLLSWLAGAQDYQWTEIVIEGTTVRETGQINDKGQVAVAATGARYGIYENGTFTPLPPLEGFRVVARGINNDGVITGFVTDPVGLQQGFILRGSAYTLFSRPGWDSTVAHAIANSGLITGNSFAFGGTPTAGFIYDPDTDTFTDVTPPGSTFNNTLGMNTSGRVTGEGREPGIGAYGFVWQQGTITKGKGELLPFLDRIKIGVLTAAQGINDSGLVVGFTTNTTGGNDGFAGTDALGYQRLVAPGGEKAGYSNYCSGINNLAQVVCYVWDSAIPANPLGAFIGSPSKGEGDKD